MNTKRFRMMVGVLTLASVFVGEAQSAPLNSTHTPGNEAARAVGPRIDFDSTNLDIGKVMAGRGVDHTFVFTNKGDQALEITDVRPTCGCTIAGTWDRRVEPGHAGNIPIRYMPPDYGDPIIFKTVIVLCNDPTRSNVVLNIKGTIWKPIEVKPPIVAFNIIGSNCQTNQTRVVHIVNNVKEPLELYEPVCDNQAFQTSLKTLQPGKEFELAVTLDPAKQSGNLTVPISIKTSSTNMPVISIIAFAVVQPEVMATPAQIMLSPGLLKTNVQSSVTIQYNQTGALVLSEPAVNVPGVEVRLRETLPGRQFVLTASFPSGFHIQKGQNVQIRVKTSDPNIPALTIPVYQTRHLMDTLDTQASNLPAAERGKEN